MSTYEDKLAAASRWPRQDAPALDVTGLGLAGDRPFDRDAAGSMVGKMLADAGSVGKVVGVRAFRDGPETFYGLQVMWTREDPRLGAHHTTLFRGDLESQSMRLLSGRESDQAERKWTSHVVLSDLSQERRSDLGLNR